MKVKVQVVIESDHREVTIIQEVTQLQQDTLHPETLGLTLASAKALLQNMQQKVVEQQVSEYLEQQSICSDCGQKRRLSTNRQHY